MAHDNEKNALAANLRATMAELVVARRPDPELAKVKSALRRWQNRRFAATYADLSRQDRYRPAVDFFLDDLYGDADMSARDADVARVLPLMIRVLPAAALLTIRDALAFEALSEALDSEVARHLPGEAIDEIAYAEAFRACGQQDKRMQQIRCVAEIGEALDTLARWPMISTTLKLMRGPARAAGLATLQKFLEEGYNAFHRMGGAQEFLATIIRRETSVVERLFAGHPRPFEVEPA